MVWPVWLLSIGKWALSKLTPRNLLYLALALGVVYLGHQAYNWTFARGAAHQAEQDAKKIAQITQSRDDLQARYDAYRGAFKTWVFRSELARHKLAQSNAQTVTTINQELAAAKAQLAKTKGRRHDIPHYVPPAVDFELPAGFVRLFNLSLQGEPGHPTSEPGISESLAFATGAPSGVALSTLAEVASDNNAECVYRGEVIRKWQFWYTQSKAQFDESQQAAADAIPRLEIEPTAPEEHGHGSAR